MRRQLSFACEGAALAASLDEAPGATGLLIVSGGNEIRSGAHRGMAMLAGRVAAAGFPVFRFDRRGIGDSEGVNGGYESSGHGLHRGARRRTVFGRGRISRDGGGLRLRRQLADCCRSF